MRALGFSASSCSWNGGLPKWPVISVPPAMIAAAASGCGSATEKFRKENPKTYKAFQEALKEAAAFAAANPEKAADIYLRVTGAKQDRDFLIKVIKNPDVQFKLEPQNTFALAEFMHKVGAIKNAPASWRDYFFDDPLTAQGS